MQYLNFSELRAKLGHRSRSAIYLDLAAGRLPQPLKLGGRLYWPEGGVSKACWFALCSCAPVRYAEVSEAQGDPPCPASIRLNSAACLPA